MNNPTPTIDIEPINQRLINYGFLILLKYNIQILVKSDHTILS